MMSTDFHASAGTAVSVIRLMVGITLLLAGYLKVRQHTDIERILANFRVPSTVRPTVSLALPWIECALGAWLLLGSWLLAALTMTLFLLGGFTTVLLVLRHRGYPGSCACFGSIDRNPIGVVQVGRNFVLIGAVATAWLLTRADSSVGAPVWQLPLLVVLVILALLVVLFAFYFLASGVEALIRQDSVGQGQ